MQFQDQIKKRQDLYNLIYNFLEYESDYVNADNEDDFNISIDQLSKKILKIIEEEEDSRDFFMEFIKIISKIAQNHYRYSNFYSKIFKILQNIGTKIKQIFSNFEVFKLFIDNINILYFFVKENIFEIDEKVSELIYDNRQLRHFFLPEIKPFLKLKESERLLLESEIYENVDEKRKEGENNSYICKLIRNDSIIEFVQYANQTNLSLFSLIKPSIFETNSFLIETNPSLIEYACFFGSTQILKYLQMNNVNLTPSLWIYAIHSNNPELIHFLEDYHALPNDKTYQECLEEAIKCHHNSIANYIKDNLMINADKVCSENSFGYSNYSFFPNVFDGYFSFFYLCKYNFSKLVSYFLMMNKEEFEKNYAQYIKIQLDMSVSENRLDAIYYFLSGQKILHNYFFEKNKQLKMIAIPPSINTFQKNTFNYSSLTEIIIPSSVTSIPESMFDKCKSLKCITIPSSVTVIDSYSFFDCLSLKKITFESPSSLKTIKWNAFCGCSSLKQILIPSSVTSIGDFAFTRCSSLTQIEIPSSVISIGFYAFKECSSLTQISINSSTKFSDIGIDSNVEVIRY